MACLLNIRSSLRSKPMLADRIEYLVITSESFLGLWQRPARRKRNDK
jgi:hypothetical protein